MFGEIFTAKTALSGRTEAAHLHNGGYRDALADHGHDDGLVYDHAWGLHDYWEAVDRALAAQ